MKKKKVSKVKLVCSCIPSPCKIDHRKQIDKEFKKEAPLDLQIELIMCAWLTLNIARISAGRKIDYKPVKDFIRSLLK